MHNLSLGSELNLPCPLNRVHGHRATPITFKTFIGHIIPHNIFVALSNNYILQIVVFAVFFGVATASIGEQARLS